MILGCRVIPGKAKSFASAGTFLKDFVTNQRDKQNKIQSREWPVFIYAEGVTGWGWVNSR